MIYKKRVPCGVEIRVSIAENQAETRFSWIPGSPYNAVQTEDIKKNGDPWLMKLMHVFNGR